MQIYNNHYATYIIVLEQHMYTSLGWVIYKQIETINNFIHQESRTCTSIERAIFKIHRQQKMPQWVGIAKKAVSFPNL